MKQTGYRCSSQLVLIVIDVNIHTCEVFGSGFSKNQRNVLGKMCAFFEAVMCHFVTTCEYTCISMDRAIEKGQICTNFIYCFTKKKLLDTNEGIHILHDMWLKLDFLVQPFKRISLFIPNYSCGFSTIFN